MTRADKKIYWLVIAQILTIMIFIIAPIMLVVGFMATASTPWTIDSEEEGLILIFFGPIYCSVGLLAYIHILDPLYRTQKFLRTFYQTDLEDTDDVLRLAEDFGLSVSPIGRMKGLRSMAKLACPYEIGQLIVALFHHTKTEVGWHPENYEQLWYRLADASTHANFSLRLDMWFNRVQRGMKSSPHQEVSERIIATIPTLEVRWW